MPNSKWGANLGGFNSEGPGYDEKTADELRELYPLTIPKPEQYEGDVISSDSFDAWIWHQELGEYKKHSGSIDPRTGQVLKGRGHRTWKEMVEGEKELGNEVILKNGRYYSRPMLGP